MRRIVLFFFVFCFLELNAQYNHFYLGRNYFSLFEKCIYSQSENHFTSFKPVLIPDLMNSNYSILDSSLEVNKLDNWFLRKLYNEHLFNYSGKNFSLNVSPVININFGKEFVEQKKISVNTRGYIVEGYLGNNISFFSSFLENQSVFPNYLNDYIKLNRVVPGQGYARGFKENGFDYAKSSGYVLIRPSENFVLQFGHGKHFIGDGYRSLLLSDNSFNYPFLRLQSNFGKFQYTNLYCEFQDIKNYLSSENDYDYMGYAKKYMSAHYLSYNLNDKFSIGMYEAVVWKTNRNLGSNGFDINYLNPIIFLRPVEYSVNSPDNVLIGLNFRYNLSSKSNLYSQIVLDEFTINEMRENNGYWANKYGYQLGYKCFDFLNLPNLTFHIERNYVRPYTYSHWNESNYGHYNEELAHPLGSNFSENILILSYRKNRIIAQIKYLDITTGSDYLNDTISYGGDIYADYNDRPSNYGIEMYNGNETEIDFFQLNLGYILNPTTNLKLEFSLTHRNQISQQYDQKTNFYSMSLVSDLFNYYYDF